MTASLNNFKSLLTNSKSTVHRVTKLVKNNKMTQEQSLGFSIYLLDASVNSEESNLRKLKRKTIFSLSTYSHKLISDLIKKNNTFWQRMKITNTLWIVSWKLTLTKRCLNWFRLTMEALKIRVTSRSNLAVFRIKQLSKLWTFLPASSKNSMNREPITKFSTSLMSVFLMS